ncbi:MAG: hypothetical protein LBG60_06885, partial [Bifidobacteriaceae bacterium]|nr:hypothetical protein [Bifidobacteriaceae bacterium]
MRSNVKPELSTSPPRRGRAKKALALGGAVALVAALSLGPAAVGAPAGLDPLPRLANGAVDFSGFTPVTGSAGALLATDGFERNGVAYGVTINVPGSWTCDSCSSALFANAITNLATRVTHTYSFDDGDAETSCYWLTQAGTR